MKYEDPSIECIYLNKEDVVVTSFLVNGSDGSDLGDWGDFDSGPIVLPPIPLN